MDKYVCECMVNTVPGPNWHDLTYDFLPMVAGTFLCLHLIMSIDRQCWRPSNGIQRGNTKAGGVGERVPEETTIFPPCLTAGNEFENI